MSKVWFFQQSTLESALQEWVAEQITAYSDRRIKLMRTVFSDAESGDG